jgi:hypothetical protein
MLLPSSGRTDSGELFNAMVDEFLSQSIDRFKVVVGVELRSAHRFYEHVGCVLHSEIEVHEGMHSRVYVWGMG